MAEQKQTERRENKRDLTAANSELLKQRLQPEKIDLDLSNSLLAPDGLFSSGGYSDIIKFSEDLNKVERQVSLSMALCVETTHATDPKLDFRFRLSNLIRKLEELPDFVRYDGLKNLKQQLNKTYLDQNQEFREVDLKMFLELNFVESKSKELKLPAELYDTREFFKKNSMPNQTYLARQLAWILDCNGSENAFLEMSDRIGLITMDLNSLKEVNDFLGSDKGNEVICKIGYHLQKICQENGWHLASRSGGDEYDTLVVFEPGSTKAENQIKLKEIGNMLSQSVNEELKAEDFVKNSGKSRENLEQVIEKKLGRKVNLTENFEKKFIFSFGHSGILLSQVLNNQSLEKTIPERCDHQEFSSTFLELAKVIAEVNLKINKPVQKKLIVEKYPYMEVFFALRGDSQKFDDETITKLKALEKNLSQMSREEAWLKYNVHSERQNMVAIEVNKAIHDFGYTSIEVKRKTELLNIYIAASEVFLKHFEKNIQQ